MESTTQATCAPAIRQPAILPAGRLSDVAATAVSESVQPRAARRPAHRPRSERMRQAIRSVLAGVSLALLTTAGIASADTANYTVQPGDSLSTVADRLGVTTGDLAVANDIGNPDVLQIGQVLRLPSGAMLRPELSSRGNRAAPVSFNWPVRGPITTYYGERGPLWRLGYHPGLDVGVPVGTPIGACGDGTVIEAESSGWNNGYGSYVKIDHGGGLISLYGHMSTVAAHVGDKVTSGTVVGYVGMTGMTTGPHVHWEVRQDGQTRDPLGYLQ